MLPQAHSVEAQRSPCLLGLPCRLSYRLLGYLKLSLGGWGALEKKGVSSRGLWDGEH